MRLSRELRLSEPVALRIARGPAMPMTWGTLAPKILLPAEAHAWPAERRRFVLLHELAHVARRDSLARTAASLACALYWFHPGAWLAARRLRLEQEYAADDRLLELGVPARGYALSLLELARRLGPRSWADHAAAMAGACQLERRVLAITKPARRDEPGLAFLSVAAVAAAFVMLVTGAGVPMGPMPESLDMPAIEPVSSARSLPASDEGRPSEPVPAMPREGVHPQDTRGALEARSVSVPPPRVTEQPRQTAPAQSAAPAPTVPASRDSVPGRDTPAPVPAARLSGIYGPRLPPELTADREIDPRIPEPLRSRNPRPPPQDDRAAGRTTGHAIARGLLRILPSLLMVNSDSIP